MTTGTILTIIISSLVGAVPFALGWFRSQMNEVPAIAKVKADYPIINTVLLQLSTATDDATLLGLVADAAYQLWSDRDVDEAFARQMTAGAVAHWKRSKFDETVPDLFDEKVIAQAQRIAASIKNSGTPLA